MLAGPAYAGPVLFVARVTSNVGRGMSIGAPRQHFPLNRLGMNAFAARPPGMHCYNPTVTANSNIYLVGMPGAGKTTVGRHLAKRVDGHLSMPITKSSREPASGSR